MIDTEREREAETQAEGEAGSMQGAQHGIRSRVSRITPRAKGRRQTAAPPRDPMMSLLDGVSPAPLFLPRSSSLCLPLQSSLNASLPPPSFHLKISFPPCSLGGILSPSPEPSDSRLLQFFKGNSTRVRGKPLRSHQIPWFPRAQYWPFGK